jgi:hypothetical protein
MSFRTPVTPMKRRYAKTLSTPIDILDLRLRTKQKDRSPKQTQYAHAPTSKLRTSQGKKEKKGNSSVTTPRLVGRLKFLSNDGIGLIHSNHQGKPLLEWIFGDCAPTTSATSCLSYYRTSSVHLRELLRYYCRYQLYSL